MARFSIESMGRREMLALLLDYYRRLVRRAWSDSSAWFFNHLLVEVAVAVLTIPVMLLAGLPESGKEWWYLAAPFTAIGVIFVLVGLFHVLLTPFRWDHIKQEFIDRWEPLDIDARLGAEPFTCALESGRFLVLPRLELINRDTEHDANLDLSIRIRLRDTEHQITLYPSVVEPAGLTEKMDDLRAGGQFLGRSATVEKERRTFGYVVAHLTMPEIAAGALERVSLGISDPVRQRAIYEDKLVWPRDEAVRAASPQ